MIKLLNDACQVLKVENTDDQLFCYLQETGKLWMNSHRKTENLYSIPINGLFDYHAGEARAPSFIEKKPKKFLFQLRNQNIHPGTGFF